MSVNNKYRWDFYCDICDMDIISKNNTGIIFSLKYVYVYNDIINHCIYRFSIYSYFKFFYVIKDGKKIYDNYIYQYDGSSPINYFVVTDYKRSYYKENPEAEGVPFATVKKGRVCFGEGSCVLKDIKLGLFKIRADKWLERWIKKHQRFLSNPLNYPAFNDIRLTLAKNDTEYEQEMKRYDGKNMF